MDPVRPAIRGPLIPMEAQRLSQELTQSCGCTRQHHIILCRLAQPPCDWPLCGHPGQAMHISQLLEDTPATGHLSHPLHMLVQGGPSHMGAAAGSFILPKKSYHLLFRLIVEFSFPDYPFPSHLEESLPGRMVISSLSAEPPYKRA